VNIQSIAPGEDPRTDDAASATPETVLVPLDGTRDALKALPIARAAALLLEAPIHLLHVTDIPVTPVQLLDQLQLRAGDIAGAVLEQASGDPAEAILHEVAAHRTRLVVMIAGEPHDDSPLGAVAETVLLRVECSLLLMRAEVAERFADESRALRHILIPLDGTPATAAAMSPAADLASRSGARLEVLHVATAGGSRGEPGTLTVPRYEDNIYHEWNAWRREFSSRFLGHFHGQRAELDVAVGEPAEEIVRVANEKACDLIVVAWKGRLAADRARTVKALLLGAPCPVLFLRTRPSLDLPHGVVEVRASGGV
jgi:nucleotide-binding universal stress UspA family protein